MNKKQYKECAHQDNDGNIICNSNGTDILCPGYSRDLQFCYFMKYGRSHSGDIICFHPKIENAVRFTIMR